ncbi:putative capsular polysaccharide synthesis family protein [Thiohalobacter thiocyanaticus]|nr:putative capsular polysaccharide synthesis family protein [Thiohalobacter thiocyanaticus]
MGKVGSSTVLNSLHNAGLGSAIFHVHLLSDALLERGELFRKSARRGTAAHLYNIALREQMLADNRRWKIISLVRDPVGRNISAFFQNLDLYAPSIAPDDLSKTELLKNIFFSEFDHERPLTWFDYEIKGTLGIDVYTDPFPMNQGYAEYHTDKFDLLILRMEDLNATGIHALRRFLGTSRIQLVKTNIGADKNYAEVYAQLRRRIDLPEDYLDKMYQSKYARHFYTQLEISDFRSRWESTFA